MNGESRLKPLADSLRSRLVKMDLGFLVMITICLLAIWPFVSRQSLPQATDTELHIFRLAELSRLVRGGEIFPRWAPNFYFGYGYPIFNYYAPLTYQLGLVVDLMPVLGPVQAVKVLFIIGLLLSGIGMYGYVRDLWGRGAGLVAGTLYVYAPYILFVDPHARGDLPESFSFGVFAITLWALDRLRRTPSAWNWLASVLLVAALILTHNLMSVVFFVLLVAWSLWQLVIRGNGQISDSLFGVKRTILSLRLYLALLLGLFLATFFWLPVALESEAVNLSSLIGEGGHFDYKNNFSEIGELLGPSEFIDWGATQANYRLNLGSVQLLLGAIGALSLLSRRSRFRSQALFFVLAFAVLLFMMLRQSSPLWEIIPLLPFLQFPWRLLGTSAAMLAILGGAGTGFLLKAIPERFEGWALAGIVGIIIIAAFPQVQIPPWAKDFGETSASRVLELELSGRWLGTTATADFLPSTVEVLPKPAPAMLEAFHNAKPLDRVNRVTLSEGTEVRTETVTPLRTLYRTTSSDDFLLRLFLFDFPGWMVTIDGQKVDTELGRPEGFLVVPVPAGEHLVEVNFGNTPPRRTALVISSLSLVVTLMIAWLVGRLKDISKPIVVNLDASESQDPADIWPVLGVSLVTLLAFVLVIEPQGHLRYDSSEFIAEPAGSQLFASFGDQAALIGYDLDRKESYPGEQVDLSLYWKATNPLDINYQVFVHLLSSDNTLVAQSDKLNPGDFPTNRWPLDKYVLDEHGLVLPEDLPAGEYAISVGLWAAEEGWRLPVLDELGSQLGDNLILPDTLVVLEK